MNFLQACLGTSVIGLFRKKKRFSNGNAWPLLTFLIARGRWGHAFATSASPKSWTKNWLCHPLPLLFIAISMILSIWLSSSYCMWHPWRTQFGAISLNLVRMSVLRMKMWLPGRGCGFVNIHTPASACWYVFQHHEQQPAMQLDRRSVRRSFASFVRVLTYKLALNYVRAWYTTPEHQLPGTVIQ